MDVFYKKHNIRDCVGSAGWDWQGIQLLISAPGRPRDPPGLTEIPRNGGQLWLVTIWGQNA